MKLLTVALCACALSACALDDDDGLETTTTQELRPVAPFDISMSVDETCILTVNANWTSDTFASSIEFTLTDSTLGLDYPFTTTFSGTTYVITQLGILAPVTKGAHRFRLDAQLLRFDGVLLYTDSYKARFACALPQF